VWVCGKKKEIVLDMKKFSQILEEQNLQLVRDKTTTLQVNVGLLCNLSCRHCHLAAGPDRTENMDLSTAKQVVAFAKKNRFETIDLTGGAPEMNENLAFLIENLAPLASRLIIRSNLVAMNAVKMESLMALCAKYRVVITASFPALNEAQAESQRGDGVFAVSLAALKKLNGLGYGKESSGLELNLVSNPTGAFVPTGQESLAERFHEVLRRKWGIEFNNLYNFANVPLGRFKDWLEESGNLDDYMGRLQKSFNPCALAGVMCRTIVSVSWDGYLYDCDFNLAADLPLAGVKTHISELDKIPEAGQQIAISEHCFACTAGAGFT